MSGVSSTPETKVTKFLKPAKTVTRTLKMTDFYVISEKIAFG
jgi:hypothetical protein